LDKEIRRQSAAMATTRHERRCFGSPSDHSSSTRSPIDVQSATALEELKARQVVEAQAFGGLRSDDRLVAVREDDSPVRHEWYSDGFHRRRVRVGLRRNHLKGLRNTSVSPMLAGGLPVHVVAA
jgi:hypothetical protein